MHGTEIQEAIDKTRVQYDEYMNRLHEKHSNDPTFDYDGISDELLLLLALTEFEEKFKNRNK